MTFLAVLNTVTGHIQSSKFRPFSHLLLIICAVKIYTGTIWLQKISYEKLLTYSVLLHYFKSDYYVPYIYKCKLSSHIQSSKFRPFSHLLSIICAVKTYTGTIWLQKVSYEKLLTYSVLLHYFKSDYLYLI